MAAGAWLLGAVTVQAEPVGREPTMIYPPTERMSALYPKIATSFGLHGEVDLRCRSVRGDQLDCTIKREAPLGFGFGRAALAVAAESRAKPDGPLPGGITLPVRFKPVDPPDGPLKEPSADSVAIFEALITRAIYKDPAAFLSAPASAFADLDPPIRVEAQAALAGMKAESPHILARAFARRADRVLAASEAARLNQLLHSEDGRYLLHAIAERKPGTPSAEWAVQGDRLEMVALLDQLLTGISAADAAVIDEELAADLSVELSGPFKRRLCARVACLPIDQADGEAAK